MGRRAAILLVLAEVSAGTLSGTTLAAFSGTTTNPGNSFAAAASFGSAPIAFVKTVGTASCNSTSLSVTVPAAGVAAGNTLIVNLALRTSDTAAVSVSDSQGNTYTVDKDVPNTVGGGTRALVLSANVATALVSGNTITATYPSSGSSIVTIAEFSGIAATSRVDATGSGTGSSSTPSASVTTTNANDLLYGAVSMRALWTVTEAASWTTHEDVDAQCGGAPGNSHGHGAYRIVSSSGTYTYNPTLSGATEWATAVVAYKGSGGGGGDTTPPSAPTLSGTAGNAENSLSWTTVTDPSTPITYQLYRNGTQVFSGSATSYTDTGLTNGTAYSYVVRATDGASNQSGDSNTVTLTPTAGGCNATAYRDAVLATSGLVSYWRLGETSGTTAADSKGTNTGTYTTGPLLGQTGLIACDTDKAVHFDGVDDHVSVVDDDATLDFSSAFSLEAWIKLDSLPSTADARVVVKSTSGYYLVVDAATDKLHCGLKQGGGFRDVLSASALTTGTVYHVVCTNDGTTLRIYVNGSQSNSSSGGSANVTTSSLTISSSGAQLHGTVDEAAVYNAALSSATVSDHHTKGTNP